MDKGAGLVVAVAVAVGCSRNDLELRVEVRWDHVTKMVEGVGRGLKCRSWRLLHAFSSTVYDVAE